MSITQYLGQRLQNQPVKVFSIDYYIQNCMSYFPLHKHRDGIGEESLRWSMRRDPTTAASCDHREQNEFGPVSTIRARFLLRRPEGQLLFRDTAKLFHPENIFLLTHRSGAESSPWQVAVFPLQVVPLRPPPPLTKKDLACQTASGEVSACSRLIRGRDVESPAVQS